MSQKILVIVSKITAIGRIYEAVYINQRHLEGGFSHGTRNLRITGLGSLTISFQKIENCMVKDTGE